MQGGGDDGGADGDDENGGSDGGDGDDGDGDGGDDVVGCYLRRGWATSHWCVMTWPSGGWLAAICPLYFLDITQDIRAGRPGGDYTPLHSIITS